MVYTTNNEPMKVYLHHVYQGDPNSRVYTKDDTERSFCLLPHTTFLLRKDIKPFTHNNEQYYSILMPTNGMIEKMHITRIQISGFLNMMKMMIVITSILSNTIKFKDT